MSNTKWYIIENHNHSSYNRTGLPVIFPGEPNLSALYIDGGLTPYRETLSEKLAQAWDKAREILAKRYFSKPSPVV